MVRSRDRTRGLETGRHFRCTPRPHHAKIGPCGSDGRPVPTGPVALASRTHTSFLSADVCVFLLSASLEVKSCRTMKPRYFSSRIGRQVLCSHQLHAENGQRKVPGPALSDPTVDFGFGQQRAAPNAVNDATVRTLTLTLTLNHGRPALRFSCCQDTKQEP